MGYDMYVQGMPSKRTDDSGYLRRNIFGMWPTLEAAVALGMAFHSTPTSDRYPDFPGEAHVTYDEDAEEYVAHTDAGREYLAAEKAHLVDHGREPTPGMPTHKFSSNDGWWVTKQECQQAVDAYDKAMANGEKHPSMFGDDVVPFLRLAAEHDGFQVH